MLPQDTCAVGDPMALASFGMIEKKGASKASMDRLMKWPPRKFWVPVRSALGW